MTVTTELGRIKAIRVGLVGRDDSSFGVHFTLGSREGWDVQDSWLFGSESNVERFEAMLADAGVTDAMQLVGKPVQATFEGNVLRHWRLLTECL